MLHLPGSRTQRRRVARGRYSSLLYGHALDLPPSPLATPALARAHANLSPIAAALRPFQGYVYRQRVLAALLRLLALAALAATATLALRIVGLALPLPAAPLAVAGVVLLAGLAILPAQRPTAPQLAHEIDRRLGLREQVASALELEYEGYEGGASADTAGLRGRATDRALRIVRDYGPSGLLPRPSLRRETYALTGLALVVAVSALLAARAPLTHPTATLAGARASAPRRGTAPRPDARAKTGTLPMKILSIGAINRTNGSRPTTPHSGHAIGATGAPGARQHGSGSGVRLVPGKGSAQGTAGHPGRAGQGSAGGALRAGDQGAPGKGAGSQSARSSDAGTRLSLSAGKNSTAGGVESPQQRALKDLQNSIQSAQARANRNGQGANGQGSGNQPASSQAASNGANTMGGQGLQGNGKPGAGNKGAGNGAGQRGRGRQGNGGRGGSQQGANGRQGQGAGNGAGPNARNGGASLTVPGQGGGSAADGAALSRRFGHPGSGTGVNSGAATGNQGPTRGAHATLNNGGDLTLNGAPDKGGRLVFSIGQPSRTTGTGGAALSGDTSGAAVSTPGYVAPDSNAITPDDRSVVQGYFTPASNQ